MDDPDYFDMRGDDIEDAIGAMQSDTHCLICIDDRGVTFRQGAECLAVISDLPDGAGRALGASFEFETSSNRDEVLQGKRSVNKWR